MPRKNNKQFYFIEGVTCSGKSTFVKSIMSVYGNHVLLEHPPISKKGQCPTWDTYRAHQETVFNDFLYQLHNCPDGVWYVDYSPFGCFPFTKALIDLGCEECASLLPQMKSALDALCRRYDCVLHRYLPITLHECIHRLESRNRLGDDTWDKTFLSYLIKRYDEFFTQDLILKRENCMRGLRDGCEIYCPLDDCVGHC